MDCYLLVCWRNFINYLFFLQSNGEIQYWEAECRKIDAANKKIFCQSNLGQNLIGSNDFSLDYDYLVIAIGARTNTFDTPGVLEHCLFLKVELSFFNSFTTDYKTMKHVFTGSMFVIFINSFDNF